MSRLPTSILHKLSDVYDHASLLFGFDLLMGVQYYSLASQAGQVEEDMMPSKWSLQHTGEGQSLLACIDAEGTQAKPHQIFGIILAVNIL